MLINLDKAVPGMKLSEDVILPNGTTLVNSSATLTENLINTLKKHKIDQIHILEESSPSDKKHTSPKINVLIENNGMSAYLQIEPTGAENESLTIEDLKDELIRKNVVFGIKESLLTEAVTKFKQSKQVYEFENIAQGSAPMAAKESDLEITVKYVNNNIDFEKIQAADFWWKLRDSSIPIQRVDKETVIARKELLIPSLPGKNVHAEDINTEEIIKTEVKLDKNVLEDEKNLTYKSLITGLTYYLDGTLGVLPVNFDGSAELTIAPDNMKADLIIHPPAEKGNPPSEKSIRDLFTENNISFGIKDKLLSDILEKLKNGKYPENPFTIAEGNPAVDGDDGKIEYLFNTDTSLKPKEDSSGNVDYKNINIIQSVKKEDEIARLIPPTEGKPGMDITGQDLPCKEGTPVSLPAGANTAAKPDDKNVLIAETDGNVRLNGQLVEIYEGYVIKGDVDYSTGNIDYGKSVSIGGDIKSGFVVKCGGDLEVSGTIEDSEVYVGGSVLCKYGFIGQGKGLIESKGDINIGFMKNQTIRCRSNVNIAREALNCKIFARKTISINGKSLSIAGGSLVARDSITCNVVGNLSGIRTTLEVGLDYTLTDEMDKTEKLLAEIYENKNKLIETLKRFERIIQIKKKLPPKEEFLYTKLKNTITKYGTQVKALEERKNKIEAKMHDVGKAFIKIGHSAMPGTLFKIEDRHHMVHEEIIGPKSVRMIKHEIRIM